MLGDHLAQLATTEDVDQVVGGAEARLNMKIDGVNGRIDSANERLELIHELMVRGLTWGAMTSGLR